MILVAAKARTAISPAQLNGTKHIDVAHIWGCVLRHVCWC